MESDPYPNVAEATKAVQYFMDEYGYTTFVSGSVNFPSGAHSQQQACMPSLLFVYVKLAPLSHKIFEQLLRLNGALFISSPDVLSVYSMGIIIREVFLV